MPWLDDVVDKGYDDATFFIHVPRCAGTSITKHRQVRYHARKNRDWYHQAGLIYFFYRYDLLEKANFPFISIENGLALCQLVIGLMLYFYLDESYPSYVIMWTFCSFGFILSTFIASAPFIGRVRIFRQAYQLTLGSWFCNWMASKKIVTGCGESGWYLHFTAEKVIRYGLITKQQMKTKSFAIVRNPYSRMVSIYMYNRVYFESFDSFCERFYREILPYKNNGQTDDWYIYCHALPMHAYTHQGTEQLIKTIIRQEDLKRFFIKSDKG